MTQSTTGSGQFAVADPESVGLSPARLERIEAAFGQQIELGNLPGAVVGVVRQGKLAYLRAMGARDPATGAPLQTDSIFSIASMTKPMVSVAALQLVESGLIALGDPVDVYLPELADLKVAHPTTQGGYRFEPATRSPTVLDLMRHTSGFTYRDRGSTPAHVQSPGSSMIASVKLSKRDFLAAMAEAPLLYDPGYVWEYGFSTDVLGHLIEAVTGQRLGAVLHERIWQPLGMAATSFVLSDTARDKYARALPHDPLNGSAVTVLHATGASVQWESGGGGALSTAQDYLAFLEMLRGGGRLGEVQILGRKTVEMMTSDQLGPDIVNEISSMEPAATGYGFGLGVAVRYEAGGSAMIGSAGDYYWSGVYGTYFWVDPAEQLSVVFMAAIPSLLRQRFRQLTRALVYQAIVD